MPVPTTSSRFQYSANGSGTSFAFPALVYFASEIIVYGYNTTTGAPPTVYVLNTDYTIDPAGLGQPTGINVVFVTAPASGIQITIARVVPFVQSVTLVEGAALPSLVVQRQLDEIVFQIQQINDQLSRTPSLPITTPIGQVVTPNITGDYVAYDVSSGTTPQLSFTPGNHKDSTSGEDWVPSIGGVLLTNSTPPILVVGSTDTKVWFDATIDITDGTIEALVIASGTSMPTDTTTHAYQLLTNIVVTVSTIATIAVKGGGVRGSQNYFYCGVLPATDGSGHLFNS